MTVMKKQHSHINIPSQKWKFFGFSHQNTKFVNLLAKTKFSQNHNARGIKEEKFCNTKM